MGPNIIQSRRSLKDLSLNHDNYLNAIMAAQASSSMILRVISQRLTVTPTWQLPHIVVHLASLLTTCKPVFATSDLKHQKNVGSDTAVLVHKFKTQLSALLQDKNPEARLVAIILIKATIETGGWEVQRVCGAWVRGLLGILSKADPPTTKELCVVALTRIFMLLEEHQSLVREITTPSLPGFITSCLSLAKSQITLGGTRKIVCHGSTLDTILQSFCKLLPHHPTLFRPFVTQIRSLILPLIAATPSNLSIEENPKLPPIIIETCVLSSRDLFVLLSSCAPKNKSAEDWAKSLHSVIESLHKTADRAFRAVIENWEPSVSRAQLNGNSTHDFAKVVCGQDEDDLGLPPWRGIHAGAERIDGLLHILKVYLTAPTNLSVKIPVGALTDATERILSIFPPYGESESEYSGPRVHPEAGKNERDGLWTSLPMLHVSALELLSLIILRLGHNSAIASDAILERSLWVFEAERSNNHVRTAVYKLISNILRLFGLSLSKPIAALLSSCVKSCCEDLIPSKDQSTPAEDSAASGPRQTSNSVSINADSYLKAPAKAAKLSANQLENVAAVSLLSLVISNVPRDFFTYSLRAQIDRTAVLIKSKQTMLASVLNPPTRRKGARETSSLMPLLTREFPCSLEVEALVRPRMPVLKPRKDDIGELISYATIEEETIEYHEQSQVAQDTQLMVDPLTPEQTESLRQSTIKYIESRATTETQPRRPPQVLETDASIDSKKRDRESSFSPGNLPQTSAPENPFSPPSSEENPVTKRARFQVNVPDLEILSSLPGIEQKHTHRQQPIVPAEPPNEISAVEVWNNTIAVPAEGMISSDESDFEMPVIDPELDTDMEDDEDEE